MITDDTYNLLAETLHRSLHHRVQQRTHLPQGAHRCSPNRIAPKSPTCSTICSPSTQRRPLDVIIPFGIEVERYMVAPGVNARHEWHAQRDELFWMISMPSWLNLRPSA